MINNWIDEKEIYPLDCTEPHVAEFREKYEFTGKYVFMYSGNIGLYYDLENIIKTNGNVQVITKDTLSGLFRTERGF